MKEKNSKLKITTTDIHLKSIFSNNYYLELGNIDLDVMNRILKYETINIKEVSYYPIQNKGLGSSNIPSEYLRDNLPFMFFKNLNNKDRTKQLFLTYGLLTYYNNDSKDRFMPVFLLPVELYFENGEFLLELTSKPFENPLIYNTFGEQYKLNFMQTKNYNDIYSLDSVLFALKKMPGLEVKLENYLTFANRKKKSIIENEKIFKQVKLDSNYYVSKVYGQKDYYMSVPYTKHQRVFLAKAMQGDNLTLSGRDGTGKTTLLKDIAINSIYNGKRVAYLTNKKETSKFIVDSFNEIGLGNIVADFTSSFSSLNNYDNKFDTLQHIDYVDEVNELKEKYNKVSEYEEVIGGRIADFRFKEVLEQIGVLVDIEHSNKDLLTEHDLQMLDYIYKNEFSIIKPNLEKIQSNLYKISSFKECVWKEIPYLNTIKSATQIMNLIQDLYNGYDKLYKNKKILENQYGLKNIENFANFKKIALCIEKVNGLNIPLKWQKNYNIYSKASELYDDLKSDLYNYQESEYILDTTYVDPFGIDINKELDIILKEHFTIEDTDAINNIFMDVSGIKSIIEQTLYNLKEYHDKKQQLTKLLGWDYSKTDEGINEFIDFIELINNNILNQRITNAVLNDKYKQTLDHITEIKKQYTIVNAEKKLYEDKYPNIKSENVREAIKTLKEEPDKVKLFKKKYNRISLVELTKLFDTYLSLNKKLKGIEDDYYVTTGFNISDSIDVNNIFNVLIEYCNKNKNKHYFEKVKIFLEGFDSRQKSNRNDVIVRHMNSFKKAYNNLLQAFNSYESYKVLDANIDFTKKISVINDVIKYLNSLFDSNERVQSHIKLLNNYYVKVEEYLELKEAVEKYQKALKVFDDNKDYPEVFDSLYDKEKTNISQVSKIIAIYHDYANILVSSEKVIESFAKLDDLKTLISQSVEELNGINDILKIYTRIFRDGVARYYYNEFESIIEYLQLLLNSKEELVYYLNITSGMKVLDEYGLSGLNEYILNNDKCDNLVNDFQFIYFSRLKDKYLKTRKLSFSNEDFVRELISIYSLEERIRLANNNNIIRSICEKSLKKSHNRVVGKRDYNGFVSKNGIKQVVVSTTSNTENGLALSKFDVIIIDDAELLTGFENVRSLKGKQIIISGSYIVHKAFSNSLLSVYFDDKTTILVDRFIPTPKKLLDKIVKIQGITQSNVYKNNGVEVIKDNIGEYIYSLYNENKDVKINYFIRDVEKQRIFNDELATVFYKNKVSDLEILNFLDYNINIVDLLSGEFYASDYNIIDYNEYQYLDSKTSASNAFDHLLIVKEKLIIYDKNDDLNKENDLPFANNIKGLTYNETYDHLYNFETYDEDLDIIKATLTERGFTVYPSKGSGDLNVVVNDHFICVMILFSNNSFSEVLNYYRDSRLMYSNHGWDIIYINMMNYENGLTSIADKVCEFIEKKKKKKGKNK